jgi:hypothetical protein
VRRIGAVVHSSFLLLGEEEGGILALVMVLFLASLDSSQGLKAGASAGILTTRVNVYPHTATEASALSTP